MVPPTGCAAALVLLGLLGAEEAQPGPSAAPRGRGHVLQAEMDDGEQQAQQRFDAALQLLRAGQAREAAQALVELGHEHPEDDVAPEALFEAAQLYEEQLGDPEAALRLYAELLERHPDSRLTRRAQGRVAALRAGLRTGAGPYLELQDILRRLREPDAIERLQRLLRQHPEFALADQARYVLGSALEQAGRLDEAETVLRELLVQRPTGEWAPRAEQLLGQMALRRGDYRRARAHFAALAGYGGPIWIAASEQGLQQTARLRLRMWLGTAAAIYLGAVALGLLLRARREVLRPPWELWYYLPVGLFLVMVAALGGGGPILRAVLRLVLGGAVLVWLGGAAARRAGPTGPLWRRAVDLIAGVVVRSLAGLALGYLAVHHSGLLDLVLDTLRDGPERD
ncbi:MAG: tetratricopeptide repeat protein [Myxococcales bacterium]|nr:tetratricopeptide repeat protein [Myxococcota bacterium]MDW8282525.1 tetratricopeptide repeat protein [Myxococcales bacterium]